MRKHEGLRVQYFGGPSDGKVAMVPPRDIRQDIEAWLRQRPLNLPYELRQHWHGFYVLSWVGNQPPEGAEDGWEGGEA